MKKSSLTSASNSFNHTNRKTVFKPEISRNKSRFIFLFPIIGILVIIYLIFFSPEKFNIDQVILNSEDVLVLKENMLPVNGFLSSDRNAKISEGKYQNGLPHGNHILYGESYTTKTEYKNGLKNGLEISHYHNGQLRSRINYVDGKLSDGLFEIWNNDGQIIRRGEILNGEFEGTYKMWYDDGQIEILANYFNGKLNGSYKKWYNNGKVASIGNYKNNELDGEYISFHLNGLTNEKSNYKNGVKDGIDIGWTNENVKLYELTFNNGDLNGLCRVWSNQGVLKFSRNINTYIEGELIIIKENSRIKLRLAKDDIGSSEMNRKTAIAAARDCEFYGYTDWRLPTRSELSYFIPLYYWRPAKTKRNYWSSSFRLTGDSAKYGWTQYESDHRHDYYSHPSIKAYDGYDVKSYYADNYVRPVR